MSTGQTILTLGAIVLLMYTAMNVNRLYLESVNSNVQSQVGSDAVNYGKDVSEMLFSQVTNYDNLDSVFGSFDNVQDPARRMSFETQIGAMMYATVELSEEKELVHGALGRLARIIVFEEVNGQFIQRSEYVTALTPI